MKEKMVRKQQENDARLSNLDADFAQFKRKLEEQEGPAATEKKILRLSEVSTTCSDEQAPTLQSSFLWTIYEAVAKEDILEVDTSMSCQDFTERLFHDEEGHPIALTEIQALRDLASVQTGRDELSPDWIWTIFERLANPELV